MSSQIPGYQVIRKVGEGGMSTVYLAIQLSVGREVALKVLSPELRSDPSFAERFYREANVVGAMSHPNIISIYDVGQHGKFYYMAMDYLPGDSCKDKIKKQTITPLSAIKTLTDITSAIEYVHDQGYLHCDIKPDNILYRANGTAVLTDFGIAREIQTETVSQTVAGTPHYMSPEQAQGHKLTKASDIYSLGVLFYEMLCGHPPYLGRDPISIAIKHVSAPIPELGEGMGVLQPFINKTMAKKAGARFQNGNELKHALEFYEAQFLQQENVKLPLKLKLQLSGEKFKSRFKRILGMRKQLKYSLRHGVILKLTDENAEIPDINAIAHTMELTTGNKTLQTMSTTSLTNDSLALALETEQARKICPAWASNTLIIVLLATIIYIATQDLIFETLDQLGQPEIIYID